MSEVTEPDAPRTREVGRTVRVTLGVLLLLVIFALAVDNRDDVRVGWVFGATRMPFFVVILAALVIGALVGWLLTQAARHRHKRNQRREHDADPA